MTSSATTVYHFELGWCWDKDCHASSEAECFELVVELSESAVIHLLGLSGNLLLLPLVECSRFDLSLFLQLGNRFRSSPTDHRAQLVSSAGSSERFDPENLEGLWNDHSLLAIVWVWDSFEDLQSLESGRASGSLMREHTSDDSPEHSGWRAEMLKLSSWVCVVRLVQELVERNVVSEKRSRKNKGLASNYDNLLSPEQLMSNF